MPSCDYSRARANNVSDAGVSAIEVIVYKPRGSALAAAAALFAIALLAITAFACGGDDNGGDRPVAFISGSEPGALWVRVSDPTPTVIRESAARDPKWSPNGSRLAFLQGSSASSGALVIWHRGDEEFFTVPGAHNNVVRHFWAPDSNRIVFETNVNGIASVYVYSTAKEEENPALVASEPIGNLELGDWSGDNRWVAMRLVTSDGPGIFQRNVEGVDEVRLTHGDDYRPRFSPDGRNVAFSRRNDDGSTDIHVVDTQWSEGAEMPSSLKMTSDIGNERDFEWSPNGRYITYVTDHDGDSEIYLLDLEDVANTQLTQNRVEDRYPRWSRADSSILFVSNADGDFDVFRMDLNSGDQRRVIATNDDELVADW